MSTLCDHNPDELDVEVVVMYAGIGGDEEKKHRCWNAVSAGFHFGCHFLHPPFAKPHRSAHLFNKGPPDAAACSVKSEQSRRLAPQSLIWFCGLHMTHFCAYLLYTVFGYVLTNIN